MSRIAQWVWNAKLVPFADAASADLPLPRLLRLALFQVSVGMALALLNGTLNRVMIVELHVPAWLVATMIALPLLFAPFRAFLGFRSDHHRSVLGWRRVPYIWSGTLLQYGGLAVMPFALMVLSGTGTAKPPAWLGETAAAIAFLMVGAGLHTTQTAGLALAGDLAPAKTRPRVVALLYVMLLVGMVGGSVAFGALLSQLLLKMRLTLQFGKALRCPLARTSILNGTSVVTALVVEFGSTTVLLSKQLVLAHVLVAHTLQLGLHELARLARAVDVWVQDLGDVGGQHCEHLVLGVNLGWGSVGRGLHLRPRLVGLALKAITTLDVLVLNGLLLCVNVVIDRVDVGVVVSTTRCNPDISTSCSWLSRAIIYCTSLFVSGSCNTIVHRNWSICIWIHHTFVIIRVLQDSINCL
ncbi:MAG: hypothetical protein EBS39_03615, partial [Gammaproteobacteria bacterium]|nr:hypothetical protein [Gammaproteobacteria bacterium]